jgi:hypothetical protein
MTKPVVKYSVGAINIAVWENGSRDGGSFNTITINRRYKDKDKEEWKNSSSLRVNDIPKVVLALNKVYETLSLKQYASSEFEQTTESSI